MKKSYILASALMLAAATTSLGQGTELFLSEYNEGAHQSGTSYNGGRSTSTGNERALEIFNPTAGPVNLDSYSVRRYSNGGTAVSEEEKLKRTTGSNVLNSADVFVYANGESTLNQILNNVDQLAAAPYGTTGPNTLVNSGIAYFNGNDALALVRWTGATAGQGTPILVDIFGVIGQDPGTSWSAQDAAGTLVTSANQSLVRRATVSTGVRTNPQPQGGTSTARTGFNISTEWESYSSAFPAGSTTADPASQSYARLGSHDYSGPYGSYAPLKTLEKFNSSINVFPNPANGQAFVQIKGAKVGSITVLNALGQRITAQPRGLSEETLMLDVSRLTPGLYFVQFVSQDGQLKVYKELMVK